MHPFLTANIVCAMICPRCDGAMHSVQRGKLTYHKCGDCAGAWVGAEQAREHAAVCEKLSLHFASSGTTSTLTCPSCETSELLVVSHAEEEVDWCRSCQGMYFDAGEFKPLVVGAATFGFWDALNHAVTRESARSDVETISANVDVDLSGFGEAIGEAFGNIVGAILSGI